VVDVVEVDKHMPDIGVVKGAATAKAVVVEVERPVVGVAVAEVAVDTVQVGKDTLSKEDSRPDSTLRFRRLKILIYFLFIFRLAICVALL
jgi:hypothetical protein